MCGIAGIFNVYQAPERELDAMARKMGAAISHRGPDDDGYWADASAGIALAHKRLSIVDLSSTGHQPMHSACGRYILVFNGEIYNHLEVRKTLENLRCGFRGTSDTEVLLEAIARFGLREALRQSVGMFALALWDRFSRILHLARDRMGEKPLYYGWCGRDFCFGSELKALQVHHGWRGEINRRSFRHFLQRGYVPGVQSIFAGIYRLSPGTFLSISADEVARNEIPIPEAYWKFRDVVQYGVNNRLLGGADELSKELEQLLVRSIRGQMVADVPVGAYLSGGVDSATIVSLMQASSARPIKTFTIGFEEKTYDEAGFARKIAHHLGTDHTEMYVKSEDAIGMIPSLPQIYDEPFSDASQIPTYLVSRLAHRHVKVSLSGDGGDELFGGYSRYADVPALWELLGLLPRGARQLARAGISSVSAQSWDRAFKVFPKLTHSRAFSGRPGDRLHKLIRILDAGSPYDLYDRFVSNGVEHLLSHSSSSDAFMLCEVEPILAEGMRAWMLAYDTVTYLPDDILVKLDRATMANSLEGRIPLLDHRVVEFACRLPDNFRVIPGNEKMLLKKILCRYMPREYFNRPKMGFGVPLRSWLRGPLRDWSESLLSPTRLKQDDFFSADGVRHIWDEHQSGTRDWHSVLWNILMFQAWLKR